MTIAKIAMPIDADQLKKLERSKRLARECAKLDASEEQEMAETDFIELINMK